MSNTTRPNRTSSVLAEDSRCTGGKSAVSGRISEERLAGSARGSVARSVLSATDATQDLRGGSVLSATDVTQDLRGAGEGAPSRRMIGGQTRVWEPSHAMRRPPSNPRLGGRPLRCSETDLGRPISLLAESRSVSTPSQRSERPSAPSDSQSLISNRRCSEQSTASSGSLATHLSCQQQLPATAAGISCRHQLPTSVESLPLPPPALPSLPSLPRSQAQ